MSLSKETVAQLKECFGFFERNGQLSLNDLPTVMRAMNINPSEKQVQEYKSKLDTTGTGSISWEAFQQFIAPLLGDEPDTKELLLSAFKVFDTNGMGFVQTSALRHVMTTLGEKYTDEEFEELIKGVDQEGYIKYDEFADRLLMTYQQLGEELLRS
eukprot:RCo036589